MDYQTISSTLYRFDQDPYLYVALAGCVCGIIYLTLSQKQKDVIARRLKLRGRRASSANTPPRSLSPDKKAPLNEAPPADYSTAFPPSRREALPIVADHVSMKQRRKLGPVELEQVVLEQNILGFETDFRKAESTRYTPTGFSIEEIEALGDFPDYAELSGVPNPQPYKEFKIETAMPRPYRPFRWAYHQTMSLTKLQPDWWVELESTYKTRIAQRKQLYEQHGGGVLKYLPGSELACKELMEMLLQYLCARYPQYFSLSKNRQTFTNAILDTTTNLKEQHPLLTILHHIPEDYAIMLRHDKTGYYHFRAGVICSALGWNVASKIGKRLHEIHAPIPDYKEKMQFSMDRYFSKMPASSPIQRGSWGLEVDTPLYMPPGDPHEKYREYQDQSLTLDRVNLRVDWQTLRRLPLSSAIVFNFKGLFTPLAEFRDEAFIPELVLTVLNNAKKNLMEYKNTWHVEHVAKPHLEQWAKEQKENGIVPKDWEPHTLEDSPWFPGWEEKWHRQQGF